MSNPILYFIGAENGLVKIGFASNYEQRYGQLCNSSPVPLQLLEGASGRR